MNWYGNVRFQENRFHWYTTPKRFSHTTSLHIVSRLLLYHIAVVRCWALILPRCCLSEEQIILCKIILFIQTQNYFTVPCYTSRIPRLVTETMHIVCFIPKIPGMTVANPQTSSPKATLLFIHSLEKTKFPATCEHYSIRKVNTFPCS